MCSRIDDVSGSFDVALISAGGWGHILLHHIRHSLNKSAIYAGGALSLHFGLTSQRILTTPEDFALVNEHFLRPDIERGRNVGGYL